MYMIAVDSEGLNSGWQSKGVWTPAADTGPTNGTATANPANTQATKVTATWSASSGGSYTGLRWGYVLINGGFTGTDGCYVRYYQPTNGLYLVNDAGNQTAGPITVGSGTLSNGQCTINGADTTVSGSGSTLTLNLSLTASPAFTGTKNIWLYMLDSEGLNSGWKQVAAWTP